MERFCLHVIAMMVFLAMMVLFTGCTVSVILTDTHGTAEDVVDSTPTQETDVQAEVPVKPIAFKA